MNQRIRITGVKPYNSEILHNRGKSRYQVFVGTPCTGLVRMEWALARFGQIIPCNWGYRSAITWIPSYAPMGYLVADGQNLIIRKFIQENCEWLFLIEHDNLLPSDCFLKMNDWMRKATEPIVSGLYFTKSNPSEPLMYRGRGTSYYGEWKIGDKVRVDAVPTGCVIIHRSIIQYLWDNSPTYDAGGGEMTRSVFTTPQCSVFDPEKGWNNSVGTSDLEFCSRVISEDVLSKTGWKKQAKMKYPFLVDTNIFVGHIDESGQQYPSDAEKLYWIKGEKKNGQKHRRNKVRV